MRRLSIASTVAFSVLVGLALGRWSVPTSALAQTVTPSSTPVSVPDEHPHGGNASGTPPAAGGMHGGEMMTNCPAMQAMLRKAVSAADRSMMQSMMGMHQSMESMHMTGNADHDFILMMIPHHQMAVAMAKVELQYGKDPKVVALAKSIIAAQQKEIDEMQVWLRQ